MLYRGICLYTLYRYTAHIQIYRYYTTIQLLQYLVFDFHLTSVTVYVNTLFPHIALLYIEMLSIRGNVVY